MEKLAVRVVFYKSYFASYKKTWADFVSGVVKEEQIRKPDSSDLFDIKHNSQIKFYIKRDGDAAELAKVLMRDSVPVDLLVYTVDKANSCAISEGSCKHLKKLRIRTIAEDVYPGTQEPCYQITLTTLVLQSPKIDELVMDFELETRTPTSRHKAQLQ